MRLPQESWIVAACLICLAAASCDHPKTLDPEAFDFRMLLGDPPGKHSSEQRAEFDTVLSLQAHRTVEQERQCMDEQSASVFIFSRVLGASFNGSELPQTAELMSQVTGRADAVSEAAAKVWSRPGPSQTDPRIHPCVKVDHTGSYPNGQAVRGMLWATLLVQVYPEQRERLMALGRKLGEDSVVAGSCYPSDVSAGQRLGVEIARRLMADDVFQGWMEDVREECQD